jgi:hypothetical protein
MVFVITLDKSLQTNGKMHKRARDLASNEETAVWNELFSTTGNLIE